MNKHFIWDEFSDQPAVIKDKKFKKALRKKYIFDFLKMFLLSFLILPIASLLMPFFRKKSINKNDFFGMGVNLDKGLEQVTLIEELGVKNLLIRMPLKDIENLEKYYEFANKFNELSKKKFLINIIQDREILANPKFLKENLEKIFSKFAPLTNEFQIGNAINRLKWGFASTKEYLEFYEIAYKLKKEKFPHINLIGGSVIDFEFYYFVSEFFNFKNIKFDKISSLLYVDRRGSPRNTQYLIFNLKNKIALLFSLCKLSPKASDEIYITEANWPIKNTAPYAPTSEIECVSLEEYSKFMLDYHKIALESGKIKKVFWHQLIAPGYGLVDNRSGEIKKYPAFFEYKKMLENLSCERIFIEIPVWLGDAIMTTPAINNIIRYFPNSKITLFGSALSTKLFEGFSNIEKVIIDDSKKHKFRLLTLYKMARNFGDFDYAFSFRRSASSRFMMSFIRSKNTFKYRRLNEKVIHQVIRYNDFVNFSLNSNYEPKDLCLKFKPFSYPKKTLGLNPGATYGNAKRWYPLEFAKIAINLAKDYDIIIFGGPGETKIANDIENELKSAGIKNYKNLAGATSIKELCEFIGGLSLFITNDSGPMHIASAYKVKTFAIFGSTSFKETDGWQNPNQHIITKNLACSPCMKRTCPLGHHNCMKLIKAQDVLKIIKKDTNERI